MLADSLSHLPNCVLQLSSAVIDAVFCSGGFRNGYLHIPPIFTKNEFPLTKSTANPNLDVDYKY